MKNAPLAASAVKIHASSIYNQSIIHNPAIPFRVRNRSFRIRNRKNRVRDPGFLVRNGAFLTRKK